MKPVEVLYSILCCLCLPCRKKTRDLGQKSKKARSTDVYDYRNVDMEKVYGRLKKRRVSQVPSVFEIFPCQWTPESASHIRNGDNSVDCTLKGGYAEVRIFGRFKVINVAEEIPLSVSHDFKLPVEPRNRRKRREKKQENPVDVNFSWDFGEEDMAEEIPRFEDDTSELSAQPEILPQKPELLDAPQEFRTEVRVIGRFDVTNVLEDIPPLEDDACKLTVNAETICKKAEVEFVDLPKEDPAEVKWWQTFNEPASFVAGYSGNTAIAPAINSSGVGDYMAAYTLLKAHAAAYRLYDEQYRATQQGKVGITINVMWYEPATDAQADIDAAERKNQFYAGLYGHPIFTSEGDYPAVVKQRVAENSQAGGYPRSRLIEFTPEEVEYIKGTADFFGLNHYTSYPTTEGVSGSNPSMDLDAGAVAGDYTDYPLAASSWLRSVPWGFRKTLNWLVQQYPGYPIFVMENGWSDTGELDDQGRIDYYGAYLAEMLNAMNEDGVPVIGYTAWSLLDNFEWGTGFTTRFGLHYVDITDPDRKRTPKASSRFLEEIFRTKTLPAKYMI